MGPIRNPRCEQKRTEGYVIVSTTDLVFFFFFCDTANKLNSHTDHDMQQDM